MKAEDKLENQLSRLGYLIAQIEYYFATDQVEYYFKRNWQGRLHSYMMKSVHQYTNEVSLEAEKRGIERGKVIGEHGCESWIE